MKYNPRHKSYKKFRASNIIGLVLVGVFLLTSLTFYLVRNYIEKKAGQNESKFTELTGVFETTDSIRAPLSGEKTNIVLLDVTSTRWSLSSKSDIDDYLYVLYYKPGTIFKANGKKYTVVGQRAYRISRDKKNDTTFTFTCGYERKQDPIPHELDGIDNKMDYYIKQLRAGDCGFGTSYHRFTITEYCYTSSDTITLRSEIRNDTIFLSTSGYRQYEH